MRPLAKNIGEAIDQLLDVAVEDGEVPFGVNVEFKDPYHQITTSWHRVSITNFGGKTYKYHAYIDYQGNITVDG